MADIGSNFIRARITADLAAGTHTEVVTRFPPEPNGWPHIGHAKALCVDFGTATLFGGRCHLRFDDTNPEGESQAYVEAIQRDIHWLGFDWGEHLYFASDYYGQLYDWAEDLITRGLAYVDESAEDVIRAHRGTVTQAGTPTPFRERPAAESLDRFRRMRAGDFEDGSMVLRAKIDLGSPNMKMRDPLMYRIRRAHHYRTGDTWCLYPFYDYAHCLGDAIEGVTHSLCSLEFENNRELYDWFVAHVPHGAAVAPQQMEFARLSLGYTVTSKRKLRQLVDNGHVTGWDDPRMPTLAGLRRRGVRPEAVVAFCERVGVARANRLIDAAIFEEVIRDDLNAEAPRLMVVLDPLEVVVTSWEEGAVDWIDADLWPHDVGHEGQRPVAFTKTLFIERDDFMMSPVPGFKRLAPGRTVRLLHGYVVTCTGADVNAAGVVTRVHVVHEPASRGGRSKTKVKGSIHWVSATQAVPVTVRIVDRLFQVPVPGADRDFLEDLNPDSLSEVTAMAEPVVAYLDGGTRWQLLRQGYFYVDPDAAAEGRVVLSRIVPLRDRWAAARAAVAPAPVAPSVPVQVVVGDRPEARDPVRAAAVEALGVEEDDARVLTDNVALDGLFQRVCGAGTSRAAGRPALVAKWLLNDVLPAVDEARLADVDAKAVSRVIELVEERSLTTRLGRVVLAEVLSVGTAPDAIVARDGLRPITDPAALRGLADQAVAAHPAEAKRFREGNPRLLGFFVGKVMKATGGKADARALQAIVKDALA